MWYWYFLVKFLFVIIFFYNLKMVEMNYFLFFSWLFLISKCNFYKYICIENIRDYVLILYEFKYFLKNDVKKWYVFFGE